MLGTVMIVDDSPQLTERVANTLVREGLFAKALTAHAGLAAYQLLLQHQVHVIICDIMLPDIDGFKFLALKREQPAFASIPVIMLTGEHDIASKVQGLSLGAADYITKPFHDTELIARVKVHLTLKMLQDELRDKNKRLDDLARMDELTQVINRRALMHTLHGEFSRAGRYNTPLGLLMCDVDHFKQVNDTHGHSIGDRVLVQVADIIRQAIRVHDTVGRYGGEEFVVVLPHTDHQGMLHVAERIREHVAAAEIRLDDKHAPLRITLSIGAMGMPNTAIPTAEALLQTADTALYAAKRHGRNRVVVATTSADSALV